MSTRNRTRCAIVSMVVIGFTIAARGTLDAAGSSNSTVSSSAVSAPTASALQAALDDFVESSGSPGGVVAVSVGGAEPIVVTSGLADRRTGAPMPDDPLFYTGKIGDQFVTAVALQLVAEGALGLDDAVATYLPDAPHAAELTVRHLLSHTSGFQDWIVGRDELTNALWERVEADPSRRFTSDEMIDLMRDRPLRFTPGSRALHSEFNVLLLRLIIEQVTGKEFGGVLADRVLSPIGLPRTAYGLDAVPHSDLLPGQVRQPGDPADRWTTDVDDAAYVTSFYSAAPIASSVSDLMHWGDALYRTSEVVPTAIADEASEVNEFGSALLGIALTEDGVCVMLVNCSAGSHDYVGFGQPSLARGAFSGLFYHQPLDAVIFVLVNNTGPSIRPLYAAVRQTLGDPEH